MYRIRTWGTANKKVHPDHFKIGLLGLSIRTLNWIRWKLETAVQYLALRYMLKHDPIDEDKQVSLLGSFRVGVAEERVRKAKESPSMSIPVEVSAQEAAPRSVRYEAGSARTVMDQAVGALPERPEPLTNLIERYGHDSRSKRYARGRKQLVFGDEDGDFEKVQQAGE